MVKSLRIYVAGPYSAKTKADHILTAHTVIQEVARNVDKAIEIGLSLIEKGHYPFIPHLSHYIHTNHFCKKDYGYWYYEFDNTFLYNWAEALYYISSSGGADAELELAKKLGLQVFYNLDDVPEAKK